MTIRRRDSDFETTMSHADYLAEFCEPSPDQLMLARIQAERSLLAEYRGAVQYYDRNRSAPAGEVTGLETALKIIASGYAARPGYDEGWRP